MKDYRLLSLLVILASTIGVKGQPFTEVSAGIGVFSENRGVASFGDYDNDGDLDLLIGGNVNEVETEMKIYRNDAGQFVDIGAAISPLGNGRADWLDYDGDGDLDLLLVGRGAFSNISRLLRNDNGLFLDIVAPFETVVSAYASSADYDSDGDLDVLLHGFQPETNQRITRLYRNDDGTFVEVQTDIRGLDSGTSDWGDFDNDGDSDLLIAGTDAAGNSQVFTEIYRNDHGILTKHEAPLVGVRASAALWSDVDNDGDLDIVLSGLERGPGPPLPVISVVYENAAGVFSARDTLTGTVNSEVLTGDYDGDWDVDLLIRGIGVNGNTKISMLYENDGGGFVEHDPALEPTSGALVQGDYDSDGDLDVLVAGETNTVSSSVTRLYRNDAQTSSTRATAPENLMAVIDAGNVLLSWDPGKVDGEPFAGLTYNIRVGSSPGESDIVPAMADPTTGFRRIVRRGNADQSGTWWLRNLSVGTYFWSVQSIDHSYRGSEFAPEQIFQILSSTSSDDETPDAIEPVFEVYPNPIRDVASLRFETRTPSEVRVSVIDVTGRLVDVPAIGRVGIGEHALPWSAAGLPAGLYVLRLQLEDRVMHQTVAVTR